MKGIQISKLVLGIFLFVVLIGCNSSTPRGTKDEVNIDSIVNAKVEERLNEINSGDEALESNDSESNEFTSREDVINYVTNCWWVGSRFKIYISPEAGFKYQSNDSRSPLICDLNYIHVIRFEGSEAVIEYSSSNLATGRDVTRSNVNKMDGTLTYGTNTLYKEGDYRVQNQSSDYHSEAEPVDAVEAATEDVHSKAKSVHTEAYDDDPAVGEISN